MRAINNMAVGLLAGALVFLFSTCLNAATMGNSQGHDLDALWAKAQKQYDLRAHDAVLLLEGRHVSILENGNLKTRVHRVVWIGTEMGIDHYADLRIPWNSAMSTFTVVALRTWRDGRWWPHESEVSETAVVETLPFALALADDYTSMRETMLLHDGVELPCIMETIYEIEERGAAKDGADDLFVFPQNDPTLFVEYRLMVPDGVTPKYRSGNGAPEPETATDEDKTTIYSWKMEKVARLGTPRISHPEVYAPNIIWSTWESWTWLTLKIISEFDKAAVLGDALADSLAARLKHGQSSISRSKATGDLVNEWTRSIDYDWEFWRLSPRPAARTWETGYGHALDRAVLAAALFRELRVNNRSCLMFRSGRYVKVYEDIPGFSYFDGIAVDRGDNVIFDPISGTMLEEQSWAAGRTTWSLNKTGTLTPHLGEVPSPMGHLELVLILELASEGRWSGTGFYDADGFLAPMSRLSGLDSAVLPWLNESVQSVLPGSRVNGYNPRNFGSSAMKLGFEFEMDAPDPGRNGNMTIAIGEPANGIMSGLPGDIHLYAEHRGSPVLLDGTMEQRIKLHLKMNGKETIHLPEPYVLKNEVGGFQLAVVRDGDWITIERTLHLRKPVTQPESWPLLRALLLEEQDPAHRTIVLK